MTTPIISPITGRQVGTITQGDPWYSDYRNIVELADWMVHAEGYTAEQLLWFIERPYRYTEEWNQMHAEES